jgi:hypothetical protein
MQKMLFWFWILANGFSSILLLIAPKFLVTNVARANTLLPWGWGASLLLLLATFSFVVIAIILPALVIRKINSNVPLWLYALGMLGYAGTWVALCLLVIRLRPILGDLTNLIGDGPSWSSLHFRGSAVLPIFLTLIWPFLCYSPIMLMSLLREKNWRFPVLLIIAFTASSWAGGIAWFIVADWFFGGYAGPTNFIQSGFDRIHFRDFQIILIWFLTSAFGAAVSYWFLRPGPAMVGVSKAEG